jgi:hypothetical protein
VQYQQSRHGRFYFRGVGRTFALIRENCLVSRARGLIWTAFDGPSVRASSRNFMQFTPNPTGSGGN